VARNAIFWLARPQSAAHTWSGRQKSWEETGNYLKQCLETQTKAICDRQPQLFLIFPLHIKTFMHKPTADRVPLWSRVSILADPLSPFYQFLPHPLPLLQRTPGLIPLGLSSAFIKACTAGISVKQGHNCSCHLTSSHPPPKLVKAPGQHGHLIIRNHQFQGNQLFFLHWFLASLKQRTIPHFDFAGTETVNNSSLFPLTISYTAGPGGKH
jgi:hypothetical protein